VPGDVAGLIVSANAFVVVWVPLSAACTVKFAVPVVVGVPLNTPALDKLSPAGTAPVVTDHVYGAVPPVAASVCEYAVPTVPLGSGELVVIDKLAGLIVSANAFVAVWVPLSAARTVKFAVPVVVGVPLNTPPLDKLSPAGSAPAVTDHV
jgi:hypothetical protein